jgi:polysaccharide pyruvyl transferase WcaK-like protein
VYWLFVGEIIHLPHIHIIHVGSIRNKGTHALLKTEILELKRLYKDVEISISTTDIASVQQQEPFLEICPPLVDIPYERADLEARRLNFERESVTYKFFLLTFTFLMFLQPFFSILSCFLIKINLKPPYRYKTIKNFFESDFIISTADENFKEGSTYLPFNIQWKLTWWSMLFARMWDIIIAKRVLKKSIIVLPNSVGPFRTSLGLFMARIIFNNVDFLMIRDPYSFSLFKSLKMKTPTLLTSDIVILFKPGQNVVAQDFGNPVIGVSPGLYDASFSKDKQRDYIMAHSKSLDYMVEKYGVNVIFLPHGISGMKYDDLFFCRMIFQNMTHKDKAKIIVARTLDEFKTYIGLLDLLISSRMHPSVLACSDSVPSVVIAYDHKQTSFFERLGLGSCIINVNQVSFHNLLHKIELIWEKREEIRQHLNTTIPTLQENVRTEIKNVCNKFLPIPQ